MGVLFPGFWRKTTGEIFGGLRLVIWRFGNLMIWRFGDGEDIR
jgi:hypothetical protein